MAAEALQSTLDADDYDEFAFYEEIAGELGLPWSGPPVVRRGEVEVGPGQALSYLRWGESLPELVLLHGGGQNAHTWDMVALALGRPLIAVDLPGHGRSSWREDRDYSPWRNAEALARVLPELAPDALAVVGMSLGGATTIRLSAERPDLAPKAVIIDVTPQVNESVARMSREERGTVALVRERPTYDSFEEVAAAAVALSPYRPAAGVRRGVRHNMTRDADGRWTWRYDLANGPAGQPRTDFTALWNDVSRIAQPAMLVIGGESRFNQPADIDEMRRRKPDLRIETVAGAGHAVQSDQPLELVRLLRDFALS
jgi:pimeloyl-ACP methyl ester carboxylesterase